MEPLPRPNEDGPDVPVDDESFAEYGTEWAVDEYGFPIAVQEPRRRDKKGERLAWAVIALTLACFFVLTPIPTLLGAIRFIAIMGLLMFLARGLRGKHEEMNDAFRFSIGLSVFVLLRWWIVLYLFP
jgi:hypothetical protein